MITVTVQIVLEGAVEDLAYVMDDLVCEGLNALQVYPSSVLIDGVEEE